MPPRFVDASVFVHAFLKPRRTLQPHEEKLKSRARAIVSRLFKGEEAVSSTVHFAEIANILEDRIPLADAHLVERGILLRDTIRILPAARRDLAEALTEAVDAKVGVTDALAIAMMRREGLSEVYSFDHDFDRFEGIRRVAA